MRSARGMTLVEILVVITILGLIAGAVAIAKPPSPAVSVMELSPMSGAACSGP